MKKTILIACLFSAVLALGQSKKNGTIFNEHPAIETVKAMLQAFVAGDSAKVASYLHDDFKSFNGSSPNKDAKGSNKQQFKNQVNFWKNNVDYLSIEPTSGAYPDALEYKDGQVWVQTWNHLKGVHNTTGVKIDVPIHRLYRF